MATTFHLDLAEAGFAGDWVELNDPRYLSQRRFEEVVAELGKAKEDPALAEKVFRDRISAWCVKDADTGATMSDPKTDDLKGLAVGVTSAIGEKITELFEATVPFRSRKA